MSNSVGNNNRVLIMRGVPCSGKTTWAKGCKNALYYSADSTRYVDGKYVYKSEENDIHHAGCLLGFITACMGTVKHKIQDQLIIVDNTNIRAIEIAPYMAIAKAHAFDCEIIEMETPLHVCLSRENDHNVPKEHILRMKQSMDALPTYWKVSYV